MKTLGNTDANGASKNVKDIKFWGNGNLFKLISKASSQKEGWMKSTKAMEIPGLGCVVQVTTQQGDQVAEAVTFVPDVFIEEEIERVYDNKHANLQFKCGISTFPLMHKVKSLLLTYGIETLGKLMDSKQFVMEIDGIGRISMKHIESQFKKYKINFGDIYTMQVKSRKLVKVGEIDVKSLAEKPSELESEKALREQNRVYLIAEIKKFRIKFDKVLYFLGKIKRTSEITLAFQGMQMSRGWLGKVLAELKAENPYPKANKVEDIPPTADTWTPQSNGQTWVNDVPHLVQINNMRNDIQELIDILDKMVYALVIKYPKVSGFLFFSFKWASEAKMWLGFELQNMREKAG